MKTWCLNCHTLVRLSTALVVSSGLNLDANACVNEQERKRNGCAVGTSREEALDVADEAAVELQDGDACEVESRPSSDDDTQAPMSAALTGKEDRFDEGQDGERWHVTFQPYIWALGNEVRIATEQYDRSDYTGYIDALLNQYQYGFLWSTVAYKAVDGATRSRVRISASPPFSSFPATQPGAAVVANSLNGHRYGTARAFGAEHCLSPPPLSLASAGGTASSKQAGAQ
jgi:hypothetical protein